MKVKDVKGSAPNSAHMAQVGEAVQLTALGVIASPVGASV